MLPVNCGSHADYQNFVVTNLRKYYPDPSALARSTWDIIERFWNLDLSFTDTFMADKYSNYDFINRLWNSDDDHMSPHIHPLKIKVKKPKTKGTKADSVEKVTVAELLPILENTGFKLDEQPYSSLFKIYQKEFLDVSVSTGLIHSDALALADDGTPVVTSHRERKKRICKCKENGITDCKCDRYFCPKISHKNGCISCTCETPCSDAKYGRTVHLVMKDNPRLFNNPPRSSKEWKLEYNARTSAERSNKREKLDFKRKESGHTFSVCLDSFLFNKAFRSSVHFYPVCIS